MTREVSLNGCNPASVTRISTGYWLLTTGY
jgi:hypothetical protein